MPNLILNPALDPPASEWLFGGHALLVTDIFHSATASAYLTAGGHPPILPFFNSVIAEFGIPVTPGLVHTVNFWGLGDNGQVVVQVQNGSQGVVVENYTDPDGSGDWQFIDAGTFVPVDPTVDIFLSIGTTQGSWHVDDIFLGPAEAPAVGRSRWNAYSNLQTLFKGINAGVNYHLDLQNRVYLRFIDPRKQLTPFPYVCIPLAKDAPVIAEEGQNYVKLEWGIQVYGFVAETAATEDTSNAVRDALYLHEDLVHVILNNRTLNGAVQNVDLESGGESIAGVDSELWGEVRLPLKVSLYVDATDLKP